MESFDGKGGRFLWTLVSRDPADCRVRFLKNLESSSDETFTITLAQGFLKGEKWEQVLRQGCEIGVFAFQPFFSRRCVVHLTERQWTKKRQRFEKILQEAARQCGRSFVPLLYDPISFSDLLKKTIDFEKAFLPYEGEAPRAAEVLKKQECFRKVLVIVGPEGGFDPKEVHAARSAGICPVHFPFPILRAETAAVVFSALVLYHGLERMHETPPS